METETFVHKARNYAYNCHASTNHLYAGKHPYSYHLDMAEKVGHEFEYYIPNEKRSIVFAGISCHDSIEDARVTWNDIAKVLGEEVAELAYALTNEKGRTRKERANKKYYKGIRKTPYATFIKLCDRIANVRYSKAEGGKMFDKYKKEQREFKKALTKRNWIMTVALWVANLFGYKPTLQYQGMWYCLDDLLNN